MVSTHTNDSNRRTRRIFDRSPTLSEREEVQLIRAERALRDLWLHILADPGVFELIADPIDTLIDVCDRTHVLGLSASSSSASTFSSDLDWEHVFPIQPSTSDSTRPHDPRTQMIDPIVGGGLYPDLCPYHSDSRSDAGATFWTRAYRRTQSQTQTDASSPAQPPCLSQPVTPGLTDPVQLASQNIASSNMTDASSATEPQHQHRSTQSQPSDHPVNPDQDSQGLLSTTSSPNNVALSNRYCGEPLQIHADSRESLDVPTTTGETLHGENSVSSETTDPLFVLYPSLRRSQQINNRIAAGNGYSFGGRFELPWWWTGTGN
ncbi:hypothetical protein DL546_008687 [Coniochaeta pulveracea]|uniref:Uncharacterized protein n=1 Tax=Coniochaeta pulveracea TaxID=177199 RepID=A0A420YG16_9PEZI|nr:hypothetical protein DL546_008687 [Coniochaeta pulveracea]